MKPLLKILYLVFFLGCTHNVNTYEKNIDMIIALDYKLRHIFWGDFRVYYDGCLGNRPDVENSGKSNNSDASWFIGEKPQELEGVLLPTNVGPSIRLVKSVVTNSEIRFKMKLFVSKSSLFDQNKVMNIIAKLKSFGDVEVIYED